jgi:two-component system, OmpR family, phosphate regulon response regulator PhoB
MSPSVLVIDDHVSLAEAFALALGGAGFDAYTAHTAEEGLRIAEARRPSVIVVDLKMPLINGVGFLYRLRSCQTFSHTPVLVVTGGRVTAEMRRDLAELKAVVRLKPIGVQALISEVTTLVNEAAAPAGGHRPTQSDETADQVAAH